MKNVLKNVRLFLKLPIILLIWLRVTMPKYSPLWQIVVITSLCFLLGTIVSAGCELVLKLDLFPISNGLPNINTVTYWISSAVAAGLALLVFRIYKYDWTQGTVLLNCVGAALGLLIGLYAGLLVLISAGTTILIAAFFVGLWQMANLKTPAQEK